MLWIKVVFLNIVFMSLIVAAFETLDLFPDSFVTYPRRHIVLREIPPNSLNTMTPTDNQVATTRLQEKDQIPYRLDTDRYGFIKPSFVHEKPDFQIAFLGGSTTECAYMSPLQRFPHLVASMIEKEKHIKVNGLNAALSGNHSMHSNLIYLAKVAPLKPNLVVLMHNMNDWATLRMLGSYWGNHRPNDHLNRGMIYREPESAGARLLDAVKRFLGVHLTNTYNSLWQIKERVKELFGALPPDEWAGQRTTRNSGGMGPALDSLDEIQKGLFKSSLETFVANVRAFHSIPVLMTMAHNPVGSSNPDFPDRETRDMAAFNEIVRDVAKRHAVHLIDLSSRFAVGHYDRLFYDNVHFNARGSKEVAEYVVQGLAPLVP